MKVRKHHLVLFAMVAFSGFIWIQYVFYLLHQFVGLQPKWNFLQYCVSAIRQHSYIHEWVTIGLNTVIAYSFGMTVWGIGKQWILSRRWSNHIRMHRNGGLTEQLNQHYSQFKARINVIDHQDLIALTSGFFRPKIVVSSKLIERLTDQELTAVLWHEWSHCTQFDPLRLLLAKTMKISLPYFPVFKYMEHYIQVWVELQADRHSVTRMKSPMHLANVLVKGLRTESGSTTGIGFANQAINYRLKQLIEPQSPVRVPLWGATSSMNTLITVLFLTSVLISGCT